MADPQTRQNAARLSDDIGEVLSAIRRMIADDDALSHARNRLRADGNARTDDVVQVDAAEFLARRHGGQAALARQMVENGPRAASAFARPGDRTAVPRFILRKGPAAIPPEPEAAPPAAEIAPLHLGGDRISPEAASPRPTRWRAWLRPDPAAAAADVSGVAPQAVTPAAPVIDEDGDDFADAFDWKARMRPAIETAVPTGGVPKALSGPRPSVWAATPGAPDTVALLAAEAAAFDAGTQAENDRSSGGEVDDQAIRDLLRQMVQDELNGELGERFSANLRIVIRREIAAAIDTHLDRF